MNTAIEKIIVPGASLKQHFGKVYLLGNGFAYREQIKALFDNATQSFSLFRISTVDVASGWEFNDPILWSALSGKHIDFVSLILNPANGAPEFLTGRVLQGFIPVEAASFMYQVNEASIAALQRLLPDFVREKGNQYVLDILANSDIISEKSTAGKSSTLSFQGRKTKKEKEEQLERDRTDFIVNAKKARASDDEASEAVDNVLKNLSDESKLRLLRHLVDSMSEEELQDFYDSYVDMSALAAHSETVIYVRKRNTGTLGSSIEDPKGNLGEYRICYTYQNQEEQTLKFITKAENAIYLCCLLARKDGIDNLDFSKAEDQFIGAYRFLYGFSYLEALKVYKGMLDNETGQGYLKDYISNIRLVLTQEFKGKENPSIFFFKKNGHLYIDKDRIHLPEGIRDEIKRLAIL